MHRNTFINAPAHLDAPSGSSPTPGSASPARSPASRATSNPPPSASVGRYIDELARTGNHPPPPRPPPSAPSPATSPNPPPPLPTPNVNYGLFKELPGRARKLDRRRAFAERAHRDLLAWGERTGVAFDPRPLALEPEAAAAR